MSDQPAIQPLETELRMIVMEIRADTHNDDIKPKAVYTDKILALFDQVISDERPTTKTNDGLPIAPGIAWNQAIDTYHHNLLERIGVKK